MVSLRISQKGYAFVRLWHVSIGDPPGIRNSCLRIRVVSLRIRCVSVGRNYHQNFVQFVQKGYAFVGLRCVYVGDPGIRYSCLRKRTVTLRISQCSTYEYVRTRWARRPYIESHTVCTNTIIICENVDKLQWYLWSSSGSAGNLR